MNLFSAWIRRVACLALACGGLVCASVAQPAAVPVREDAASSGMRSMTVKVLDAVGDGPVAGAAVVLPAFAPHPGVERGTNEWRFVTDERGVAQVRFPGEISVGNYFALVVSNASYPPRTATWYMQSGSVGRALPAEYVCRLERGMGIGGFVRDERGQPLAGVKVVPWGTGAGAFVQNFQGQGDPRVQEYSSLERNDTNGVTTDAKGFWVCTNFPADISPARVDVVRPGGGRSQFASSVQINNVGEDAEEVSLDALRATNAVLVIKDGVTVHGIVVDESGRPVPGTRFRERGGGAWNTPLHRFTNNADGKFELPNRAAVQYLLTAEADGYAMASMIVTPAAGMSEVRMVLPAALPRLVRVVSENGEPVAGAGLGVVEYRNRGHLLDWSVKTDAQGRAVWSNAPRQELTVAVSASNLPPRMARLKVDGAEQVIRLRKGAEASIAVRVKAADAESGQPLARFDVWRDVQWGNAMKAVGWSGTNGEFRGELSARDFQQGVGAAYRLQVRAEGYAPWSSGEIYFDEGDLELAARLKKAVAPAGVVYQPDGQPAAAAKLMLNNNNQNSIFANAPDRYYPNDGVISLDAGADGSFRFDAGEDEQRLVVTHRTGFASLTLAELRRSGKVPLQAWGRIDGTLRVAGEPLAKERLNLKAPVSWEALEGVHLLFSTTTDAAGKFSFTNLPPGDFLLYRMPHQIMNLSHTESHRLIVSVKPGETKQVDYGFGGRVVVGRMEAGGEVDWQNDPHLLAVKLSSPPPAPNYYAYADPKEFEKARKAHGKSAAFLDYERKRQQFQLVFDRDGNFKIDDVPPGKYELTVRATKPLKDSRMGRYSGNEQVLGTLKREIVVPAGKPGEEFDLGTLEMEVKESSGMRLPPLDFTAETLDGKPFNLLSVRGKPAVVLFWAKWAPHSPARLADLRSAFDGLGANRGAAFITVNLDEGADVAREGLKGLDAGWTHTRLTGLPLVEVTERLGVDTLPVVLLLDAEGRVTGRDVGGKRLGTAINRLVKQTAKK